MKDQTTFIDCLAVYFSPHDGEAVRAHTQFRTEKEEERGSLHQTRLCSCADLLM